MISANDRARIKNLPTWARVLIKQLESLPTVAVEEAAKARQENTVLKERCQRLSEANGALLELLNCAGKGGLDWAAKVVGILEGYEIFKNALEEAKL